MTAGESGPTAMPRIARVVADIALDREFDYAVPDNLEATVALGSRVSIPFGRSVRTGYVVGFPETAAHPSLKSILGVVDNKPFIDEKMIELTRWIGGYYCASVEQSIRTALPGAVRRHGAKFKEQLFVSLIDENTATLSAAQAAVVEALRARATAMPLSELTHALGISASPVRTLEKKGIVRVGPESVLRAPLADLTILPTQPLELMPQQAEALSLIRKSVDAGEPPVVLLFGVTGSGKTEVYLQAIVHVLERDQGVIVLVPEISLTPQTVERFVSRFGKRVAVLHSHLSEGERHDEWHRIRDGKADIVIGARSAIFAPVKRLGLIVVDEEHEPSYKQEEAPRYNARDVAVMRGRLEQCSVVLGSATPSLESWHNARQGKYGLACLPDRADNRRMPHVRIVDMRVETQRAGHLSVFSRELIDAIRGRIERAEQTILFLNRRGFATSLICPKCGYVAKCEQCSVSMTYHRQDDRMHCHICGAAAPAPQRCPACSDPSFKMAGVGTQRVESIVTKLFPHARIQRMDSDVTKRKDAYERIFGDFRSGKIDILIGTQMIAKGLHFPNVTLVGVVYADLGLHIADFRAGERTFQLLAQVAGRAGRGVVAGEVIVQTYTPFHPALQAARRIDFEGFCDQEAEFRRELSYPPFSRVVCVTLRGPAEEVVAYCATVLGGRIRAQAAARVKMAEPCPAPLARAKGQYRYQIMMRCPSVKAMTEPIEAVLKDFKLPKDLVCTVDVDALNLM